MFNRTKRFLTKTFKSFTRRVKDFFVGLGRHAEAAVILTLSAFGLTTLSGEIPFYMAMPSWIEAPLVIPILSVLAITALIKSMEVRGRKRYSLVP